MKSEVYRLSRAPIPRKSGFSSYASLTPNRSLPGGTLRWQAPELMRGAQVLTPEMDVYAFAISCVEILTKGALPWPLMDDDAVRRFVLSGYFHVFLPNISNLLFSLLYSRHISREHEAIASNIATDYRSAHERHPCELGPTSCQQTIV
jgi:serine/threonine protein kinase